MVVPASIGDAGRSGWPRNGHFGVVLRWLERSWPQARALRLPEPGARSRPARAARRRPARAARGRPARVGPAPFQRAEERSFPRRSGMPAVPDATGTAISGSSLAGWNARGPRRDAPPRWVGTLLAPGGTRHGTPLAPDRTRPGPPGHATTGHLPGRERNVEPAGAGGAYLEALSSVRRQRVQTSAFVGAPFCSMTRGCRFGCMRRWARTRFIPDDCGLKPPIETLPQIAQERAMRNLKDVVRWRHAGRVDPGGRYDSTRSRPVPRR